MYHGKPDQFGAPQLERRLQAMLGHIDFGNGTPTADAVSTALKLDLRMSGRQDGPAVVQALSDDEIISVAAELMWIYEHANVEIVLPLGTIVKSRRLGDVRFGDETWLMDAGRPGLHPMESMRRGAHGPNLALLLAQIKRLTRNLACRRIGLPSPIFIVERDDRHLLHFQPCEEAGGVVLQRCANGTDAPRFASASPAQILAFAESIVADMRSLWKRRKAIALRTKEVRDIVDPAAARHGCEVQLVAVDLSHQRDAERIDMYVHYLGVDEAMRTGPVLDFIPCRDHISSKSYGAPAGVSYRPRDLAELRTLGADGRIDGIAAAVADAAPGGAAAVFAELATAYEATFEISTTVKPMFVTLYWRDGVIRAEISMAGMLDWCGTNLEITGHILPETVKDMLPGRSVDTVASIPFACSSKVKRVHELGWGIRLELEVEERLIDLTTGRIWDDPTSKRP